MSRNLFGGTEDDRVEAVWTFGRRKVLTLAPGVRVRFYSAETGGVEYTDLTEDEAGTIPTTVTSDAKGYYAAFYGPDLIEEMWAEADASSRRFLVVPQGRRGPAGPAGPGGSNEDVAGYVTTDGPTKTALAATYGRPIRLLDETQFTITDTSTQPRPVDAIGSTLYGATDGGAVALHRSTDRGDTWELVHDFGSGSSILGVRETGDGEVLLLKRSDGLYKSSGWATNPLTATWAQVLAPTDGAWFLPWGVAVSGSLCVAVEYSLSGGDRTASRGCWTSTDSGATWTQQLDLNTMYPGQESATHWHGATIDDTVTPKRAWATHGDGVKGVYYAGADNLASWTLLSDAHQPTTLVSDTLGIVAGTDETPDGLQFIERRDAMAVGHLYSIRYPSGGLAYQSQRAIKANGTSLIAMSAQPAGAPHVLLGTTDGGGSAYEVARWTPADSAEATTLSHIVADADGYLYVHFNVFDTVTQWRRYRMVGATETRQRSPEPVEKNSLTSDGATASGSGTAYGVGANAGNDRGVAIGYTAVASASRSIAIGRGATASGATYPVAIGDLASAASEAVAVGASATVSSATGVAIGRSSSTAGGTAIGYRATAATGTGTAIGRDAKVPASGSSSTAIGYAAEATAGDATAIGAGAVVAGSDGIAIGRTTSTLTWQRSVVIGTNLTATGSDQVRFGGKHIELDELAGDPAAPAANAGRLYFKDDGAGNTLLCVRTAAGVKTVTMA